MHLSRLSHRRLPVGAEPMGEAGVSFRVWAPERRRVRVVLEGPGRARRTLHQLEAEGDGYFSAAIAEARAGTLYRFLLDEDPTPYPDPASRFQPNGPHGRSEVVDPFAYVWSDDAWRGLRPDGY